MMTTFVRILLVVLGLTGSLREAAAAACQGLCSLDASTAADCSRPCAAAESSCDLPCDAPCAPETPCPLFDPAPPGVLERPVVQAAAPDPRHHTVGPIEMPPPGAALAADHDPHAAVAARAGAPPGTARTRPHATSLWLLDRALLI